MSKSLCCYTVSVDYMLPALVSASQLRAATPRDLTEVGIICFGDLGGQTDTVRAVCAELSILLILLPISELGDMPIASARLMLDDFLPAEFDNIVYLDADTQVLSSVEPLIKAPMMGYSLLAVIDPKALASTHPTRFRQASLRHFRNIGLDTSTDIRYFNSGVMRFTRREWKTISAECITILRAKPHHFIHPDQDALNIVVGRNFGALSLKWNFPGFFIRSHIEVEVCPIIVHFMSNPRPWDGSFRPWGIKYQQPYQLFQDKYLASTFSRRPISTRKYLKYLLLTRVKQIHERGVWTGRGGTRAVRQNEFDAIV